jgi:hypothetical protein
MRKIAADSIADEMFSLLRKNASWQKKANEEMEAVKEMKHDAKDDSVENNSADYSDDSDDDSEDNLEDFLMADDVEEKDDASYVDDEISDMRDMSDDNKINNLMRQFGNAKDDDMPDDSLTASASDRHLMQGLGKIEASLRRKGEGFAADLVRTTALSIQEDIVKEASQKTYVLRNLIKMASDLDRKGERKAASMVKETIAKINR